MKLWPILRKYFTCKFRFFKLFACAAGVSLIFFGDFFLVNTKKIATISPTSSKPQKTIKQIASDITVKIWATDALGSGIIWERQDSSYIVITNKHVLRAGEQPYHIQTPDRQIHHARVLNNSRLDSYDIAILRFQAVHNSYQTAILGNVANLTVGESIFAAGFPYNQDKITPHLQQSPHKIPGLALKNGRISVVLDQALEEGYQIGYTSDVQKGMSGGPLLNSQGEVVGVNGKHAYPLWDAPDFYQDGSQPCLPLQRLITRSSLAIPLQTIFQMTPPANFLPEYDDRLHLKSNQQYISASANSHQDNQKKELIEKMQAEAESSKSCRQLSQDGDLSEVKE